jgi:uncharacterized protein (DUF1800 family)
MMKIWIVSIFLLSVSAFSAEKKSDLIHMFNRLSFGPRPNELKSFLASKMSKEDWVEAQLNPEKIDDHELEVKLSHIKSLDMEARDIINFYKKPEELAADLGIKMDEGDSKRDLRKEVQNAIGSDRFPQALITEMQTQKLIRAVESKKQLQELLVDFWYNHFNVDVGKNEIKYVGYNYENEVIRKNVFKTFPAMLMASAHHPAMLVYLDNRLNRKKGINENYAREVMELHTLGVDGGYTQNDVQALASIFTGWMIKDFKENPKFEFNEKAHDKEEKKWMGQTFLKSDQNGVEEGERALMFLALHPKTAHHISEKLVAYFVDDNPPATLVKKCEDKFMATKGDLKEVYRTLFSSAEFWNPKYHQSKIKKPFQLIASSLRAMGGEILNSNDLEKSAKLMGEELYRSGPPTGYKDEASIWVNSGSMITRLQFALDLSSQKFSGVLVQWPHVDDKKQTLDQQIASMTQDLGINPLSVISSKIIKKEMEAESSHFANNEMKPSFIGKMAGMILGSPEFQRK